MESCVLRDIVSERLLPEQLTKRGSGSGMGFPTGRAAEGGATPRLPGAPHLVLPQASICPYFWNPQGRQQPSGTGVLPDPWGLGQVTHLPGRQGRMLRKLARTCVCEHEGPAPWSHGALPQPLGPSAPHFVQRKPKASHGAHHHHHAERTCLRPQGRAAQRQGEARSSPAHSQDAVESSSVALSSQSDHGGHGQSPGLGAFKYSRAGPLPSMRGGEVTGSSLYIQRR